MLRQNRTIRTELLAAEAADALFVIDLQGDNLSFDWEPKDCIVSGDDTSSPVVVADETKDSKPYKPRTMSIIE